jgi:hypothetical protein
MLQVCPGGSRAAHRQADWFLGLRRAANFDLPERGRGEARLASADSLRSRPCITRRYAQRGSRIPVQQVDIHSRRSARVSGYRAGRYLLSVTAPVQLERCHPADPGRRAREAAGAGHKLTVSADFNAGDPPRGGCAARAVLHDSPGHELRAPGTGDTRAEWVTRNCRQRRLGTKWESPALALAPEGSLPLTCAWLHLREHGDDLVRKIRMHSWGSRGRGFM